MAHIVLYKDEFDNDVWAEYCDICGEDSSAIKLTIIFDRNNGVVAEY